MSWLVPVTPVLRRLRGEDCKFKTSLRCNSEFQASLSLRNSERPDRSVGAEERDRESVKGRGRGIPECKDTGFHAQQKAQRNWGLEVVKHQVLELGFDPRQTCFRVRGSAVTLER